MKPLYSRATHVELVTDLVYRMPSASVWRHTVYIVKGQALQALVIVVDESVDITGGILAISPGSDVTPYAAFYSDGQYWWCVDRYGAAGGGGGGGGGGFTDVSPVALTAYPCTQFDAGVSLAVADIMLDSTMMRRVVSFTGAGNEVIVTGTQFVTSSPVASSSWLFCRVWA